MQIPVTDELFPRESRRGDRAAKKSSCEECSPELALTCTPRPRAAELDSSVILADAPSACICVKELQKLLICRYNKSRIRVTTVAECKQLRGGFSTIVFIALKTGDCDIFY